MAFPSPKYPIANYPTGFRMGHSWRDNLPWDSLLKDSLLWDGLLWDNS